MGFDVTSIGNNGWRCGWKNLLLLGCCLGENDDDNAWAIPQIMVVRSCRKKDKPKPLFADKPVTLTQACVKVKAQKSKRIASFVVVSKPPRSDIYAGKCLQAPPFSFLPIILSNKRICKVVTIATPRGWPPNQWYFPSATRKARKSEISSRFCKKRYASPEKAKHQDPGDDLHSTIRFRRIPYDFFLHQLCLSLRHYHTFSSSFSSSFVI